MSNHVTLKHNWLMSSQTLKPAIIFSVFKAEKYGTCTLLWQRNGMTNRHPKQGYTVYII